MKKALFTVIFPLVLFSCKKEKPEPAPAPEEIKTGTVNLQIQTYDSLGQPTANRDGIKVLLDASKAAATATTDTSGKVSFSNITYGNMFPSFLKDHFEGAPLMVTLNGPQVSYTVPVAQRSTFKALNFQAQIVKKDSITVSFSLDKPVPAGKSVKVAVIASSGNALTSETYESADILNTTISTINKLNIANFTKFKNLVTTLDSNATFYINVIPVSYGEYESNLLPKPLLLGDNQFPPDKWILKKNWK